MSLLWVDKYRPTSLKELDFHSKQASLVANVLDSGDCPHFLIYGQSGVGKKTFVMAMLRHLYGNGVDKLKIDSQNIKTPSNKQLDISTLSSLYHIEVNPSDAGFHDRVVVQELIKSVADTRQLDTSQQKEFKVVVMNEVDKLTKEAQHALRRTMEKYIETCRLILICQSTTRVIGAIRSRCLPIRLPSPSETQIVSAMQTVSLKEGINLPASLAERIAKQSDGNVRQALLSLEAAKIRNYPFDPNQAVVEPDWLIFIRDTAKLAMAKQTPEQLLSVRTNLYQLLTHCIPVNIIFKHLLIELLAKTDPDVHSELIAMAAQFECNLQLGSKPIVHLEAFVANFMATQIDYLESLADL